MHRKLLLSILLASFVSLVFSQKKQKIYFLKNDGKHVKSSDKADYIRVIQEPDSGSHYYNLYEYYPDKAKKRLGKVSKFEPFLVYEETLISYFQNGNKQEVTTYQNGKQVGLKFSYYKNGKVKQSTISDVDIVENAVKGKQTGNSSNVRLMSYFDSTGVELISNGTGHYKTFEEKPKIIEEGDYLNGRKNGRWGGTYPESGGFFEEYYEDGKFIKGTAKLPDGTTNEYSSLEVMPEFPGGVTKFYEYVGRTYRYPVEAARSGVQGRVIVSFVVEKDGSLTDCMIIRDLGYGTGEEAIRVVLKSPKWTPGRRHGIPERILFTLPIALGPRSALTGKN